MFDIYMLIHTADVRSNPEVDITFMKVIWYGSIIFHSDYNFFSPSDFAFGQHLD